MPIKEKNIARLRPAADELILRLENIPEPDKHELHGSGSISVATLIEQLREWKTIGKNFMNEYIRPSGNFRLRIDTRLAEIEAIYGIESPKGITVHQTRIRR